MAVQTVLNEVEKRGEALVVVQGIPAYYPRFGFERADALGITPPYSSIRPEAFVVKRLSAYSSGIRGQVIYPSTFDFMHEHDV